MRLYHTFVIVVVEALILKEREVNWSLESLLYDLGLEALQIVVTFHLHHDSRSRGIELRLQQALR